MKPCRICHKTLPAKEFYKHPQMADGRLNMCRMCACAATLEHYYKTHSARCEYERKRYKDPKRREYVRQQQKKYRRLNPEKYAARSAVSNALRSGTIVRPNTCPNCGSKDRLQAHHHDYAKPLDVSWACFKCHRSMYHGQVVTE